MSSPGFRRLASIACVLALGIIVLGAYVRLSDAGLGCPDWPGCYGQIIGVPSGQEEVREANEAWPERHVEAPKAWKEMVHRYFAGILGLIVLALAIWALRRRSEPGQPVALPLFLLALIIFQALLGMWTVTLLVKPAVVLAHLLGGMTTLALLVWLVLRVSPAAAPVTGSGIRGPALLALVVLVVQIALGGWVSTNYAALACYDLPTCQGQWWPPMDFADAFTLWRGTGIDYEGGVLGNDARVAIHMVHRIGAIVAFLIIGWGASRAMARGGPSLRPVAAAALALLVVQVGLGIANVLLSLPLYVAVAHNGVAALLLAALVIMNFRLVESR